MNARVETRGNEVDAALIGGDVEQDVRIVAGKLSELWCEDGWRCKWRHQQAHASGRPVTKRGKVVQRPPNIAERRPQMSQQLFAGFRRCDAPGRPGEQSDADL